MMSYYFAWRPYVSVAEKRRQAEREVAKLKKRGQSITPVKIEGRTIAKSFWGQAWCTNLERYSDYENRLPRGRSYVRNGSVVDLQIAKGEVTAMVAGSDLYRIIIAISPVKLPAGRRSVAIVREPSIRWLSCCRVVWPRASWIEFVGRATACFHRRVRSNFPVAVRTGPICASTLRRRSMASESGSTKGLGFFSCCAAWTKTN